MEQLNVLFVLFTPEERLKILRLLPELQKLGIFAHTAFWKKHQKKVGLDLDEAQALVVQHNCKVVLLKGADFNTIFLFDAVTSFKRLGCCVILIQEGEDWPSRNFGEHGRIGFILKAPKIAEEIRRFYKPKEAV